MALSRAQLADPNCEVTDSDYNDIEAAIKETSRGRWFLSEYARRNRHADTNLILSAISNIKQILDLNRSPLSPYQVKIHFTSAYLTNQLQRNLTPLQLSQPLPTVAESPPTPQPPQDVANIVDVFEFELSGADKIIDA
jgi:hypothetical protein